jgi:hypothetical protein
MSKINKQISLDSSGSSEPFKSKSWWSARDYMANNSIKIEPNAEVCGAKELIVNNKSF